MKINQALMSIVLATATLCTGGSALAGPAVNITFKNLGTEAATFKIVSTDELSSYRNSTPKPKMTIPPQSTDTFSVQSTLTPDINTAGVRYTMGNKTCVFGTAFLNQINGAALILGGPEKDPKWTKTAGASNGATCTATIKSLSMINFSWSVEFTMK